jgi:putative DNA primase/helicase
MVVSTGEVSIASKVEEDRNRRARAGQEVRILDIPADAGQGHGAFDAPRAGEDSAADLADEIVRSGEEFYGTAGPAFLQAIIDRGIDQTVDYITNAIEAFSTNVAKFGTDGQIRRAARRLALIAAAGELAHALGIVPHWSEGEATAAAEFALQQWIAGRGGSEAAEAIQGVRAVRLFIEKYGDSRFEDLFVEKYRDGECADEPVGKIIQNRAGWRRGKGEDQIWMVLPEVFKSEVCNGLDPTMVAKVLVDRGLLLRGPDEYQKTHRIQGKVLKLYTITASIFSGSNIETPVTSVTPVTRNETGGFLHSDPEGVTAEKFPENEPVTGVTGVTVDLDKDTEWGLTKDEHRGEPDPDGDEDDLSNPAHFLHRGP